jgi:hypothetical protein
MDFGSQTTCSEYNQLQVGFRVKENAYGSIDKLKAHLVARGFTQQYGIDYMERFNPVVKPATVCLVLSLAISRGWGIHQIGINNAFLHGFLDESAYLQQPLRFEDPSQPHYVCKLKKALYGLKQSLRVWYSQFSDRLCQIWFQPSAANTSLFVYHSAHLTIYMLVFVDDIVIVSSSSKAA